MVCLEKGYIYMLKTLQCAALHLLGGSVHSVADLVSLCKESFLLLYLYHDGLRFLVMPLPLKLILVFPFKRYLIIILPP